MPLTKDFKDTIKARAERDPEFRAGLFREAIEAMLSDDLETGKVHTTEVKRLTSPHGNTQSHRTGGTYITPESKSP